MNKEWRVKPPRPHHSVPFLSQMSLTCRECPGQLYHLLHEPQPLNSCWQSCLSPNQPLTWWTNTYRHLHNPALIWTLTVFFSGFLVWIKKTLNFRNENQITCGFTHIDSCNIPVRACQGPEIKLCKFDQFNSHDSLPYYNWANFVNFWMKGCKTEPFRSQSSQSPSTHFY